MILNGMREGTCTAARESTGSTGAPTAGPPNEPSWAMMMMAGNVPSSAGKSRVFFPLPAASSGETRQFLVSSI